MESSSCGGAENLGNKRQLRVVETTYDIDHLNAARQSGLQILIITVSKNPALMLRSLLLKNKDTSEIIQVSGWMVNRQYGLPPLVYSEKEWELVYQVNDYARVRKSEQNWGAYILPERVGIGERLYIADLIEDVMATAFWGTVWYAADGIAEWNGTDLIIDLHEYDRFEMIG